MAETILTGLNAAQREAVTSPADIVQVLAPPGSGKTKTLTARVAYLLASRQLKPWNIIVCTFTVKAAKEMKDRITKFVGEECARQLKLGTFHSVALRYLKQYGGYIGLNKDFGIADTSDSKAITGRIIKTNGFTMDAKSARSRISSQKAKGISSVAYAKKNKNVELQEFAQIYQQYEDALQASSLLDYDDILLRCCDLLRTQRDCVSNVEALLIDEFQDTNTTQYDLMWLLAQRHNVITIVGDPDQSIYSFRSAEIQNLGRMKEHRPETLTINLEHNYRSSGAILTAAQHLIEQDTSRPPKKLQATHTPGLRPVLRKLPSAIAEAEWLVSEVQRMRALTGDLLQPDDFAILLRSANLSRVIETALGRAGIPYRMVGGTRFYDRWEVKLLVDYLRVVENPSNSEAVERIINAPARGIGDATVKALKEEAQTKGVSLWQFVRAVAQGQRKPKKELKGAARAGLDKFAGIILDGQRKLQSMGDQGASLVDLLQLLIKKLGLQEYIKKKYPDECEARWLNVEELLAQATDASDPARMQAMVEENDLPIIDGVEQRALSASDDALSLFLANIVLSTSGEEKAEKEGERITQLTVSTIHAAKGLEWPVVFIPACYDGSIPHSRAEDHDEERRLLYVGMTRAQVLLYLSSSQRNSQREEACLSTFLSQPGVGRHFEEHGPNIAASDVEALATVLSRDCPPAAKIRAAKAKLERDEDNYWPLNGEEPCGYSKERYTDDLGPIEAGKFRPASGLVSANVTMQLSDSFSTASATMKPGFVSAKAQYQDVLEQQRLQRIEKRAAESKKSVESPKGRKRQIESKGTIASFFAKRSKSAEENIAAAVDEVIVTDVSIEQRAGAAGNRPPLGEVDDGNNVAARPLQPNYLSQGRKLPATASLRRPPAMRRNEHAEPARAYVFLSSSPQKPEPKESTVENPRAERSMPDETVNLRPSLPKPATTLHNTTMSSAVPHRRTLGMRRSLHGWSARAGRH